jgi:hypothetical protein
VAELSDPFASTREKCGRGCVGAGASRSVGGGVGAREAWEGVWLEGVWGTALRRFRGVVHITHQGVHALFFFVNAYLGVGDDRGSYLGVGDNGGVLSVCFFTFF